jgi:hypothetical protein
VRSIISNELEPFAYLIYMVALLLYYRQFRLNRYTILIIYYAGAAMVLYAGIFITSYLNEWTYNLVYLANICVFSWYFWQLLPVLRKRQIILFCLFINISLFIYFDIVSAAFYTNFNGFVYGITFISIVVYTLLYLHQILADIKEENLLMNFDFWLVCGYLLHFLGSFVVVIYYELVDIYNKAAIWAIQNIILFICALITLIATLKISYKQKLLQDG